MAVLAAQVSAVRAWLAHAANAAHHRRIRQAWHKPLLRRMLHGWLARLEHWQAVRIFAADASERRLDEADL